MAIKEAVKFWAKQFPFIYPGSIIASCAEWIDAQNQRKGNYIGGRGAWHKTIFPDEFRHNSAPRSLGKPQNSAFSNNRSYPVAKALLFCLRNCYVFGNMGIVLTARHEVFQEFSHHFGIETIKKFLRRRPFYLFTGKAKKITGVGAVLISPESQNYYHWMNDVLPRIRLYQDVAEEVDYFCIADDVPVKFVRVLAEFNIPVEKILTVSEREKLHFDFLYVASLPGSEGRSPEWAVQYVRQKLIRLPMRAPALRKFYLRRGDAVERRILNEAELMDILCKHGFEVIETGELDIAAQCALMQQAGTIVAMHGAALTNLIFAPENTTVVEIFSPDYFRTDCYYTLSGILNLRYHYLAGNKPPEARWGDIEVNTKELAAWLENAGDAS